MQQFQTTKMDVDRVRQLLVDRKEDLYVRERMSENVLGPAPQFDRGEFLVCTLGMPTNNSTAIHSRLSG